jgi:hypothetical protein
MAVIYSAVATYVLREAKFLKQRNLLGSRKLTIFSVLNLYFESLAWDPRIPIQFKIQNTRNLDLNRRKTQLKFDFDCSLT